MFTSVDSHLHQFHGQGINTYENSYVCFSLCVFVCSQPVSASASASASASVSVSVSASKCCTRPSPAADPDRLVLFI